MNSHSFLHLQFSFLLQNLHTLPATPIFKICKPNTFSKSQLAWCIYFRIKIQTFSAKNTLKSLFLSAVSSPSSAVGDNFVELENKSNIFSTSSAFSFSEFVPLSLHMIPLAWEVQEKRRMQISVKTPCYSI